MSALRAVKGHGTENDFVVVPDLDGQLDLTPELVRALCDRHAGIGADGVLRVVRSANDPAAKEMAADAEYFMDYRNADGSVAEMCGNGVRVFAKYLSSVGLVDRDVAVATRGGVKRALLTDDGHVTVEMGRPHALAIQPIVTVANQLDGLVGIALEIPNPHVVVWPDRLDDLELSRPPQVVPGLAHGQNVEFVVRRGDRHIAMRVHERGVGETRSCGTGMCAAVVATAWRDGAESGDGGTWLVDVPGGQCEVHWGADGNVTLSGPAVLVAEVQLSTQWLAGVAR